ncbi:MAG TPA: methyltransferase domain-containing protein, partial [Rhodanobacteraceae bacterium]
MNKAPEPDTRQIRHAFGRAASTYEQHDALARELEVRLLDSLDYYEGQPARVLDVGCGSGRGTAVLRKRWRHADVIALDFALPMLRAARHHAGWRHPFQRIAADARHLPFPDHCMDVVY